MQKTLTLLFSLILFCPKSQSQDVSPPLIKKVVNLVNFDSAGLEIDIGKIDHFYDYDGDGNLIKEQEVWYFEDGTVATHNGIENEYNALGNIIKRSYQHYNSDVDLWINDYFRDYFYDDNNCLIGETLYENVISNLTKLEWTYTNNNNCLKFSEEYKIVSPTNTKRQNKMFYEYTDGKLSFIKKDIFSNDISIPDPIRVRESSYNENEEITYELNYESYPDTVFISDFFYNYTLDDYDNGLLKSKKIEIFFRLSNSPPSNADSILLSTVQNEFEYDCQGNLIKEINSPYQSNTSDKAYISYFYAGKDDCFDHKENLKMKIFPNPTSDYINISSPLFGSGVTTVRMIDIYGRIIFEEFIDSRLSEQSFDLRKYYLSPGNYIVQLMSGEYQLNEKLIFVE